MVHKSVYLAGPISGLTYEEASGWRDLVCDSLTPHGIKCLSPLRAAIHLRDHKGLLTDCEIVPGLECVVKAMSTPMGVVTRDRFDATHCSVLFLNLLGSKKVSIGSMVEVGWANANNIPIVLIIEPEGNPHEHAFVTECCQFRTTSIWDGVQIVKAILGDY
jgi:nucleoside 2-deoxyribosyltransferase